MDLLHILLPIAIGALIGYCTNYIAIKMLFHPRKELRIGGWKLPFTPGVIPKNQSRIAAAAGAAVGGSLLTGEDLSAVLKSQAMEETIAGSIAGGILKTDYSLGMCLEKLSGTSRQAAMDKAAVLLTEKIKSGLLKVDFAELIVQAAAPALLERTKGTMLAMFINEAAIASLAEPVAQGIESYLEENGGEVIFPLVKGELSQMEDKAAGALLQSCGADFDAVKKVIADLYRGVIDQYGPEILSHFDVAKLVEDKINEMKVEELEVLVMSVMKQELQAVINLGALIGAVIGVLNVFI